MMNKKESKFYCTECGTRQVLVRTEGFSKETGEPNSKSVCPDRFECEKGCWENGGHFFPGNYFGSRRCARCGVRGATNNGNW